MIYELVRLDVRLPVLGPLGGGVDGDDGGGRVGAVDLLDAGGDRVAWAAGEDEAHANSSWYS